MYLSIGVVLLWLVALGWPLFRKVGLSVRDTIVGFVKVLTITKVVGGLSLVPPVFWIYENRTTFVSYVSLMWNGVSTYLFSTLSMAIRALVSTFVVCVVVASVVYYLVTSLSTRSKAKTGVRTVLGVAASSVAPAVLTGVIVLAGSASVVYLANRLARYLYTKYPHGFASHTYPSLSDTSSNANDSARAPATPGNPEGSPPRGFANGLNAVTSFVILTLCAFGSALGISSVFQQARNIKFVSDTVKSIWDATSSVKGKALTVSQDTFDR